MKRHIAATLLASAVILSLLLAASESIYRQDLRLCMQEGSRADCEARLK